MSPTLNVALLDLAVVGVMVRSTSYVGLGRFFFAADIEVLVCSTRSDFTNSVGISEIKRDGRFLEVLPNTVLDSAFTR